MFQFDFENFEGHHVQIWPRDSFGRPLSKSKHTWPKIFTHFWCNFNQKNAEYLMRNDSKMCLPCQVGWSRGKIRPNPAKNHFKKTFEASHVKIQKRNRSTKRFEKWPGLFCWKDLSLRSKDESQRHERGNAALKVCLCSVARQRLRDFHIKVAF